MIRSVFTVESAGRHVLVHVRYAGGDQWIETLAFESAGTALPLVVPWRTTGEA